LSYYGYQDLIDIRLGEFKPKIENFSPLDFFQRLKAVHKDSANTSICFKIFDPEKLLSRVNGEKKRFLYLASKLIKNSILRSN
jgi:hypothetical protein